MKPAHGSEFASLTAAAQEQGELRVVWRSQFGDILIEVKGGAVYVAGDLVEPAKTSDLAAAAASGEQAQEK